MILNKSNRLDYDIGKGAIFEPLDIDCLSKLISKKRILWINHQLFSKINTFEEIKNEMLFVPKIGGLMRKASFQNNHLKALYEYYVKAIEKVLKYEF